MMGESNFVDFDKPVDPAVDAIFDEVQDRRSELMLTPQERTKRKLQKERARKRKAKEKRKIKERRVKRATYDLPPVLRSQVMEIAAEKSIPASQLVAWLLTRGFEQFGSNAEDLSEVLLPYLSPSRSPRYTWNLRRFIEGEEEN